MRINEIFYSLQGEGHYCGVPAVFVRTSGCNLCCSFCDTEHETYTEMTEAEIVEAVCQYPARHVVITGGEPTLQITPSLLAALHARGCYVQIETNGTIPLPDDFQVDWVTCSPKHSPVRLDHIDELKVVYQGQDMSQYDIYEAKEYRLQPLDTQSEAHNRDILSRTIDYCLAHPKWKLSLQTHKMIGVR